MSVDVETVTILKRAGLGKDALWHHKQSGKWIMYHWACEKAGATVGVRWEPPQVIQADAQHKLAVVLVTGRLGEAVEWTFGEAAPYNTTQTYPFAMAEKRGKDRVILKLLGLHGQVYSEEEADEFRNAPGAPTVPQDARGGAGGQDDAPELPLRSEVPPRANGDMQPEQAKLIAGLLKDAPAEKVMHVWNAQLPVIEGLRPKLRDRLLDLRDELLEKA